MGERSTHPLGREGSSLKKKRKKTTITDRLRYRVNWKEKPKWLLCIDPGAVTGYALYFKGRLVCCGYGLFDKVVDMDLLQGVSDYREVTVLFEHPISYSGPRSKSDPNKLFVNVARMGELRYKYRTLGCRIEQAYPVQWKGNIPKPEKAEDEYVIETRLLALLSPEEKKLIYRSNSARARRLDHNMIDAGGMGAWRLGRR